MRKLNLADWPAELERQLAALPEAIGAALVVIGAGAAEIARNKIGHYQQGVDGAGYAFPEWDPLAFLTVDDKTRAGFAPPDNPLLRSGEMRSSISFFTDGLTVVIGSTDRIAEYQELGTHTIPPRPFIGPAMIEAEPLLRRELGRALAVTLSGERYQPEAAL